MGSRTSGKKNPRGCARNKSLPFSLDFLDLHFRTQSRVKIALSHIPSQKRKLILSAVQKKSEINKEQNLGMNNVEYRIDRYTLETSLNKQPPSLHGRLRGCKSVRVGLALCSALMDLLSWLQRALGELENGEVVTLKGWFFLSRD